jgi:CubicO group peptidase (beta-lactamase class C family)
LRRLSFAKVSAGAAVGRTHQVGVVAGGRLTPRVRGAGVVGVAGAICAALLACSSVAAAEGMSPCTGKNILTASGCTSPAAAGREVRAIVERSIQDNGLRAAVVRVDLGNRSLIRLAAGESMAGVPANLRMHFRIGSIAIPYVIDLLLQLRDRGRLSLDDPVSKWLPDLPNADRVTLRMLANSTSGYADWIQENPDFVKVLFADPFRQWRTSELLEIVLARPLVCQPGACFHYAHTNFIVLGMVIQDVTGKPVEKLLRSRILRPLGLRNTRISALPRIPPPVLHSYTSERGPYEDSTFWSPSWTIAASMIMTGTIGDVLKSAKAFGTGALISKAAARERIAPTSAALPGFTQSLYYGLGVVISNTWEIQNPELNGYTAIMGYLPSRRISVALVVTKGERAAATGNNYSQLLFTAISEYLTPDHPAMLPG